MTIPLEVYYTTTGKKQRKSRNVVGVICPKALVTAIGYINPIIYVNMGNVDVNWNETSPGFEILYSKGLLSGKYSYEH